MSTEQELRDSLQPMIRDELMKSWREGVSVGLKMAHKMADAVRDEVIRCGDGCSGEEGVGGGAQIAVLSGLMSGLLAAADEALIPPPA